MGSISYWPAAGAAGGSRVTSEGPFTLGRNACGKHGHGHKSDAEPLPTLVSALQVLEKEKETENIVQGVPF